MLNSSAFQIQTTKLGVLIKDARIGSDKSIEDCAKAMGIAPPEYEAYERGEQAPDDFQEEVLEPFQLNIVHQISRALQFYASSNEYSNISTIYLSGGTATLSGMAPMVQQELGMTTRVADPIAGLEFAHNVAVAALKRNGTNLMIAMGLALRGFD